MPPRTLPGLGLTAYWGTGASGWDVEHDPDTRMLSVLCQFRVQSRSTVLPGSPTDGDIFIVPAEDLTNPNEIAVRDDGAWVYLIPATGFLVYVDDERDYFRWNSAEWVHLTRSEIDEEPASFSLAAGVPCGSRVRTTAAAANTVGIDDDATTFYPIGFWFEIEQAGAGQATVVPASGVTVNTPETLATRAQFCVVKLMKVAADEWTLSGDVEPL